MTDFAETIAAAYKADGAVVDLGRGVHDGKLEQAAVVQVPLSMMNRHGLVAGATGTGGMNGAGGNTGACATS